MAHHKSAKKRIRANDRRRIANKTYLSSVRTAIKKLRTAAAGLKSGGDANQVLELMKNTQSLIAKAATKGVIHKNNASRKISRLTKMVESAKA